ncbi:hypothetical protein BKK51_05650 [Rodentibacter trehalosifermentans]|uniref:Uncharacterized protein n=2 Tax=Rodentibacter trehalosifermentans TaxID=1908263 RepID=A0A1V3J0I6_9PAST|nr:hypothetical protein [Rodentibacter trehalosifermentans]OOF45668.1 hypothetical protein BKK51_05650 [Rodentibacter trehalosifermentans]OOF48431.1 hypothetical protein BKK52_05995 [Rodentibacter trehalosifermentans]
MVALIDLNKKLTKQQAYIAIANTIRGENMVYHRKTQVIWRYMKKNKAIANPCSRNELERRIINEIRTFYKPEFPNGFNYDEIAKIFNMVVKSLPEVEINIVKGKIIEGDL